MELLCGMWYVINVLINVLVVDLCASPFEVAALTFAPAGEQEDGVAAQEGLYVAADVVCVGTLGAGTDVEGRYDFVTFLHELLADAGYAGLARFDVGGDG